MIRIDLIVLFILIFANCGGKGKNQQHIAVDYLPQRPTIERESSSGIGKDSGKNESSVSEKTESKSEVSIKSELMKTKEKQSEIKKCYDTVKRAVIEEKRPAGIKKPTDKNKPNDVKKVAVVQKIIVKETPNKSTNQEYEGLLVRSEKYYKRALEFIGKQNDSALLYANSANSCFENGSIFRVKAQAFYNMGNYSSASIACDVCLARNDHWDINDLNRCSDLKCKTLQKLYEKYPSTGSKEAYESACGSNNSFIHHNK